MVKIKDIVQLNSDEREYDVVAAIKEKDGIQYLDVECLWIGEGIISGKIVMGCAHPVDFWSGIPMSKKALMYGGYKCKTCPKAAEDDHNFCPNCGQRLK